MMIEISKLTKKYGEKEVVKNISFTVNQGDVFGFLGPNGAGKTTTIKMMTGQLEPTSGMLKIGGEEVREKKELYREIGIVFELPNLCMKATIKDNLTLFGKIYDLPRQRVNDVMEDLQLLDKKDMNVGKLSKGWKQRVLIARALLHRPKVLILDEPTSGLDPNTTTLLHNYIKKLNQEGMTIIITTHDMKEADLLCNRIGIINQGEMSVIGSPEELKEKYQDKEIQVQYKEGNQIITARMPSKDEQTKENILNLMKEDRLIYYSQRSISLGDVFSKVTGGKLS